MAQENRFSLGAEVAFPMGDFGDAAGIGLGGTLGFELPVSDNLGLIAQAGYMSFAGKEFTVSVGGFSATTKTDATGIIPIQVGAKYYFTDNQEGFYAGLLTGVHMTSVKVPEYDAAGMQSGTKNETNSNFSLAPLVGFIIGENIDIAVRYQMIFAKQETVSFNPTTFAVVTESKTVTNSYLGLRIAYMFGER
ncbi:MAG: hypothetical protein LKM36_08535 [Flavobacteriales bacterium]|nr:outer membrane beta-barrel protein [Flavobacteriales bacterium]MBP9159657.1 outer membrane beta-barrel protein [Flavobacteriales bacterium]MCI1752894.1 hypothetical protein [Flavobacteriales bacterium]